MKITIGGATMIIHAPIPKDALATIAILSGRKIWSKDNVQVAPSPHNVKLLQDSQIQIEWDDQSRALQDIADFQALPTQNDISGELDSHGYVPKAKLYEHQIKALAQLAQRKAAGYLFEIGLGKSATTITNFGILYKQNLVTGAILVAPNGVHFKWITEQIAEHLDESIPVSSIVFNPTRRYSDWQFNAPNKLNILAMNTDAIRTTKGNECARKFLELHAGKSFMIIDESHDIQNYSSQRAKAAINLARNATYRRILTGTPIIKNVHNLWSQFMFLDPKIIGIYDFTAFKARFCQMGGIGNKVIVGSRNVEELYSLIAPHIFRITVPECVDLPEQIFINKEFELSEKTAKHYENLKHIFLTQLHNGEILETVNALSSMTRLQQCAAGFLPKNDGTLDIFGDDRLKAMMEIVTQREGATIVWCRFIKDVERIKKTIEAEYPNSVATIEEVDSFMDKSKRFLVCNPARGGVGWNFQKVDCLTNIYYNCAFGFKLRHQSEGRTHRIGMGNQSVTYFDLLATINGKKTIDHVIKASILETKEVSDLTLDVIRQMISAMEVAPEGLRE